MAIVLNRRRLALLILILLGPALVLAALKTRPAASAPPAHVRPALKTGSASGAASSAGAARVLRDPFFTEYRMERDKALSLEASLLRDVVDNPLSGSEARQKAQDELLRLGREQAELVQLEGLVHAEGFDDAAVFLDNRGVTVVVGGVPVSPSRAAVLVRVLARQAGVSPASVAIVQRP